MSTLSEDKKVELLNDHYKDSFLNIKDSLKLRDRLFFGVLAVITIMLYQIYLPQEAGNAIGQFIAKGLNLEKPINTSFIGSVIWFILLGLVVRYFQTVVYIERQYDYIHNLEDQLSSLYNNMAFTREGKSYLSNYPYFSDWVWILYANFFPILLIIVIIAKILNEIRFAGLSALSIFDILVSVSIVVSTILYLCMIHFKK